MPALKKQPAFDPLFTPAERKVFASLSAPIDVQRFLDSIAYSPDPFSRSPRGVIRDRKANCYDGALFSAAALRRMGFPPLLVDLRAVRDDDHVLAVFKLRGHWGSIGKSNFVGLRYREPIFKTIRELVLSYFEDYFNEHGEKTLRSYTLPFDLRRFDALEWMTSDARLEELAGHLNKARHVPALTPRMVEELAPVDPRSLKAGMVGTVRAGLYKGT